MMKCCTDGFVTMSRHCENNSRVWEEARSVCALVVNTEHTETSFVQQYTSAHINPTARDRYSYRRMHSRCPLTFAVRFEISVHRRGLAVTDHWPARRGLWTGAEAHVGGRRDLLPQGGELHGARGHGHIVGFVDGLRQTAGVMVWRGVGAHGDIVLVHLLRGLAAHWHHPFVFLRGTSHTCVHKKRTDIASMRLPLNSLLYYYNRPLVFSRPFSCIIIVVRNYPETLHF